MRPGGAKKAKKGITCAVKPVKQNQYRLRILVFRYSTQAAMEVTGLLSRKVSILPGLSIDYYRWIYKLARILKYCCDRKLVSLKYD